MTSRLWWVFASAVAWSLAQVIGAPTRTEPLPRPALAPAPRRLVLTHREPLHQPERPALSPLPSGLDEPPPESLIRPYLTERQRTLT